MLGIWLVCAARFSTAASEFDRWAPITATDKSAVIPAEFPQDCAAVVNFYHFDVDDSNFPIRREVRKYIRYTVFDPEKAKGMAKMEDLLATGTGYWPGDFTFKVRLTQPDGSTKQYGDEVIVSTDVDTKVATTWWERFGGGRATTRVDKALVIPGIEKGTIIDLRISWDDTRPAQMYNYVLQWRGAPTLKLLFIQHLPVGGNWNTAPSLTNGRANGASITPTPSLSTISAENLPPLYDEPFSPPLMERALAVVGDFLPAHGGMRTYYPIPRFKIEPKAGPWANYATIAYVAENDFTQHQSDFSQLADKLVAGAKSETEKAKKIHDYVHARYLQYLDGDLSKRVERTRYQDARPSEVIAFENNKTLIIEPEAFIFLAVGLFRATGLKAQALMLPNAEYLFFSPTVASNIYLSQGAIRVFADGAWHFSDPGTPMPVPFDALPYWNRGQSGLIVQPDKDEFIPIPVAPPSHSETKFEGQFNLSEDGSLTGKGKATYTGDRALQWKSELRLLTEQKRTETFVNSFTKTFLTSKVVIANVSGVDDLDAPVVVSFEIGIDDFATITDDRMIFRPCIFNGRIAALLPAKSRHNPVKQPYAYEESEDLVIKFPPGYAVESTAVPPPMDAGAAHVAYQGSFPLAKTAIRFQRNYSSSILFADTKVYPALKHWYDALAAADRYEIGIAKTTLAIPAKDTHP